MFSLGRPPTRIARPPPLENFTRVISFLLATKEGRSESSSELEDLSLSSSLIDNGLSFSPFFSLGGKEHFSLFGGEESGGSLDKNLSLPPYILSGLPRRD